ncbi:hypothetical protein AAIG97_34975, partial [Pseudomonas aeruginosa]|uniref:hypothetical protein n=1 Tax=Pseudomonas aeruginosa TaxID=287 RepID=UPI0031B782CF
RGIQRGDLLQAIDDPASYFLIGEHFDRWAVLVDAVVSAKRRNKSVTNSDNGIIMLQHGSLASLGECNSVEETDFPISLPVLVDAVVSAKRRNK